MQFEQSVPRLMARTSKDLLEEPNILEGIYNDKSSRRWIGAMPFNDLNVKSRILKSIQFGHWKPM